MLIIRLCDAARRFAGRISCGPVIVTAMLALSGCAISDSIPQPAESFSITTGSFGGVYYPMGVAVCRMWNGEPTLAARRCISQTSAGSIQNIDRVLAGSANFGLVQADILNALPQDRKDQLRVVLAGPIEALTIVLNPASNVSKVEDLKGKRLALGPQGSGQRRTIQSLFAAFGWQANDVVDVPAPSSGQQSRMLCMGQLDAAIYVVAPPSGYVNEAITACGGVVAGLSPPVIERLIGGNPAFQPVTISRDAYRYMVTDAQTLGVRSYIVARATESADRVYQFTRLLVGESAQLRRQHPALADLASKELAQNAALVPRHAGAERYLREAKLIP